MPTISKNTVKYISITEAEDGQRLDNVLIKILKGVPKSHIQRIIRAGEVRLNKKRTTAAERVKNGDTVRIPPVRTAQTHALPAQAAIPCRTFETVYEDDALLVINKPAGIAVHGGSGIDFGVIEQIRRTRPESRYLELVHRLDKDTSGLLMIAKKRSALLRLHEDLRQNKPQKTYLALGVGCLAQDRIHVRLPLVKYIGTQGEKMVRVNENGQTAHTILQVCGRFSGSIVHQIGISSLTFVKATLKTGRTHQIRVHMQSQGCPIAGDERYGDYQANKRLQKLGLKRMFLHAAKLRLNHPSNGSVLHLQAPLPQPLAQFLSLLENQPS